MKKLLLGMMFLAVAGGCRTMTIYDLHARYPAFDVVRKRVDQTPASVYRTVYRNGQPVQRRATIGRRTAYIIVLRSPQGIFQDVAVPPYIFNQVRENTRFPAFPGGPTVYIATQPSATPPPVQPGVANFCSACGARVNPGIRYCPTCGKPVR